MTGVLKILTVGLWSVILIIWMGGLWVGIPADVADDVTKGIVEPMAPEIDRAIQKRRALSALILIPALTVFGLIVYAIKQQKDRLFYIGMTLTLTPLLIIGIIGLMQGSEMPYKNITLTAILIPLTLGLIKGLIEILGKRKIVKE